MALLNCHYGQIVCHQPEFKQIGGQMPLYGSDIILNSPAFIHETASIYGKVRLEEGSSVWANAVIRAECHEVVIGEKANIQDFVMIHIGWSFGCIYW